MTEDALVVACKAVSVLLSAVGHALGEGDQRILLKRPDEITGTDRTRASAILASAWRGFFFCAATGHAFVPLQRIEEQLGRALDENYPDASDEFLKFATSYWTLKLAAADLSRDARYRKTGIQQLLCKIETDLGSVFFPAPGATGVPASKREEIQRALLGESGAPIDLEEFMRGNPGAAKKGRK